MQRADLVGDFRTTARALAQRQPRAWVLLGCHLKGRVTDPEARARDDTSNEGSMIFIHHPAFHDVQGPLGQRFGANSQSQIDKPAA